MACTLGSRKKGWSSPSRTRRLFLTNGSPWSKTPTATSSSSSGAYDSAISIHIEEVILPVGPAELRRDLDRGCTLSHRTRADARGAPGGGRGEALPGEILHPALPVVLPGAGSGGPP